MSFLEIKLYWKAIWQIFKCVMGYDEWAGLDAMRTLNKAIKLNRCSTIRGLAD